MQKSRRCAPETQRLKRTWTCLLEESHNIKSPDPVPLGQYRGFAMELYFEIASKEFRLTLSNTARHTVSLGADIHGNIQRIDNVLDGLEARMLDQENALKRAKFKLDIAKAEVQRPLPQEDELKEKQAQLDQLNIKLNMDQKESAPLDAEPTDEERKDRKSKEWLRRIENCCRKVLIIQACIAASRSNGWPFWVAVGWAVPAIRASMPGPASEL